MDLSPPMANGDVHTAYANPRPEVTPLIPASARSVLDLGCSSGVMGEALRQRGHRVVGVELDPQLAALARPRLDAVVEADLEALAASGSALGGPFDSVVAADVLEHLRDPWAVLARLRDLLRPGALVFASTPNVAHREIILMLLRGRWELRSYGALDATHLRWFTPSSLRAAFEAAGYVVDSVGPLGPLGPGSRIVDRALRGHARHLWHRQIDLRAHVPEPAS